MGFWVGYKTINFLLFAKFCASCFYISVRGGWFPNSNNYRTNLEKINKYANGSERRGSKFSWKWVRIAEYGLSIHNLKLVRLLFRPIYCLQTKRPLTRLFNIRRIIHTSPVIRWFVRPQYKMEAPSLYILDGLPSWFKLVMWVTYFKFRCWMTTCLGKSCSFGLSRVPFVNGCQCMYLVLSLLVLRTGYGIWWYQFMIIVYLFYFAVDRQTQTDGKGDLNFGFTVQNNTYMF